MDRIKFFSDGQLFDLCFLGGINFGIAHQQPGRKEGINWNGPETSPNPIWSSTELWVRELRVVGTKGGVKSWHTDPFSTLTGFSSTLLATRIVKGIS